MRHFQTSMHLRFSPKSKIQSVPYRSVFDHAKRGKYSPKIGWRGLPQCRQRTMVTKLKIHVKHALVPAARAYGMFRIVADRVNYSLQETDAENLGILGHKNDVTQLLVSNFVDELGKTGGASQVQRAAWFASVPIPTGNHWALPNGGEPYHTSIFRPGAHGVQFEGVQVFGVAL